eukprot:TRINITY_DN66729_c0_g3_i1.p1 TRINITY_DN66729_c0_g3~~TRINITY_DN66729_c0_g3_i1.p1  ORF type:complete len:103 (+),score=1.44 TRINITY_DN66729_c0_g3_i1:73-381(+)
MFTVFVVILWIFDSCNNQHHADIAFDQHDVATPTFSHAADVLSRTIMCCVSDEVKLIKMKMHHSETLVFTSKPPVCGLNCVGLVANFLTWVTNAMAASCKPV